MSLALIVAGVSTGVVVVLLARGLLNPPMRLAARVEPYAVSARVRLGLMPGITDPSVVARSALGGVLGPIVDRLAGRLDRLLGGSRGKHLELSIRQSGLFDDVPERDRVDTYRLRQLRSVAVWGAGSIMAVPVFDLGGTQFAGLCLLLLTVGATRERGALERAIEQRRNRMRIEIYTVNQLLALRFRAGGGIVSAVSAICERGRGEVVGELSEAMRMHRAGTPISTAFGGIARLTPEPFCARTYALIGLAEERGVDLADALLALSEDVREARRESIKRSATRRRAAMLVPTIAILAPVMLLFVGAPLPQLLLGW